VWVSGNNRQHCNVAYVCGHLREYFAYRIAGFSTSQNQARMHVCVWSFSNFSLRCILASYTSEYLSLIFGASSQNALRGKEKYIFPPGKILRYE
jgi:hypothetical protein